MTGRERRRLARGLSSLGVFRGILHSVTMTALVSVLNAKSIKEKTDAYGEFVYSLADDNYSFSDFLRRVVCSDENAYVVATAKKREVPSFLKENAVKELQLFTELSGLTAEDVFGKNRHGYIPVFANDRVDFVGMYEDRLKNVDKYGYGIFASAKMFRFDGKEIVPVRSADGISADEFVGYEEERRKVFENTEALCEGKPAANVLLFGDAGTGKSSTVKACANYFADRGVRLIELRKDQLLDLSYVMGRIADNPLKFIVFIDDLSFNKNDDSFSMLKATLEGSAASKAGNAVIYATSNRRHIVKECFSDRETGDDIHHSDTVQELMSLSDRFGLTVYFGKPDKATYLTIVRKLAERKGINLPQERLDTEAEAFALNRGSRSPRAAEQYVDSLLQRGDNE